jgi:hypothetical protein
MATFTFNKKSLEEAPKGKHYCASSQSKVNGAILRCQKGKNRITFYLKHNKLNSDIKLGVFPALSVEEARLELAKQSIELLGNSDKVTRKLAEMKGIPTLAEGIQKYIDKELEGKPSQQNQQRLFNRRILNHPIARTPMDEIEMGHAKDFLKDLAKIPSRKGGFLTVDVNHCRQLCSASYNYALERNSYLKKNHFNPFGFKNTIKTASTEKDNACIDVDVLTKVLFYVSNSRFSDAKKGCYLTSLFTGQHNSEIYRMKWTELQKDGFWKFRNIKNPELEHKVYLHAVIRTFIERFGNRSSEYVFATQDGKQVRDLQKINVKVNNMLKAEGHDIRFNTQHHRHSVGLFLISEGFRDSHVQRILGHTPTITLHKHYVPITDDIYKGAMVHWGNHIMQKSFIDSIDVRRDIPDKKTARVIRRKFIKSSEAKFLPNTHTE